MCDAENNFQTYNIDNNNNNNESNIKLSIKLGFYIVSLLFLKIGFFLTFLYSFYEYSKNFVNAIWFYLVSYLIGQTFYYIFSYLYKKLKLKITNTKSKINSLSILKNYNGNKERRWVLHVDPNEELVDEELEDELESLSCGAQNGNNSEGSYETGELDGGNNNYDTGNLETELQPEEPNLEMEFEDEFEEEKPPMLLLENGPIQTSITDNIEGLKFHISEFCNKPSKLVKFIKERDGFIKKNVDKLSKVVLPDNFIFPKWHFRGILNNRKTFISEKGVYSNTLERVNFKSKRIFGRKAFTIYPSKYKKNEIDFKMVEQLLGYKINSNSFLDDLYMDYLSNNFSDILLCKHRDIDYIICIVEPSNEFRRYFSHCKLVSLKFLFDCIRLNQFLDPNSDISYTV